MKLRIYNYEFEKRRVNQIDSSNIPIEVSHKIKLFTDEVIREYLKKQNGKKGIKSLGNEIRYNSFINDNIFKSSSDYEIIKITGNKKDFLTDFLKSVDFSNQSPIYFFLFSKAFVRMSSIVDNTSTTIENVENYLNLLFSKLTPNFNLNFYFLELYKIENYKFTEEYDGYKKIYKIG